MSYPVPGNEALRLTCIDELKILNTPPHSDFDNLVTVAQNSFQLPMVALSIIERDRQWFKARIGIEEAQTTREAAFCAHTVCADGPLVVQDATADRRFCENPFVTGAPWLRSYAGVPLNMAPGVSVGTLCVMGTEPRNFLNSELKLLRQLGDLAEAMLEKHKLASENARVAKALSDQVRLFDSACDLAKLGGWEIDRDNNRLIWTDSMYALHDLEPGTDIKLQDQLSRYLASDRLRLEAMISEFENTNDPFSFEGRMYTDKGVLKWVRLVSDVDVADGRVIRRFGMKQDITEHKQLQHRVERLAQRDDLTGVLNRRGLRSHLLDWSRVHADGAFPLTYITFDLDNFKDINDSFGHAAGDVCLRKIARRARVALRDTGQIARTGGDEFSILRTGDCRSQGTRGFVTTLMAAIAKPVIWGKHSFSLRASVGWSERAAGTAFDPEDLVREADLALYGAKQEGRNCFRAYSPLMGRRLGEKTAVLDEARAALRENRFELYYQPKIAMHDGSADGFECLLRMNTAEGKVLSPAAFQAALDDTAVSKEIGDFVVEAALDQAARWKAERVPFGSLAINLSTSQCREQDFAGSLLKKIAARDLPPTAVQVEVTEGVFLSAASEAVFEACKILSDGGVRIAFDDFGTGFASLTHLRDFPVNELKIDRSFVGDLARPGNQAIVAAMVNLGNALSMKVVAEGIETETQANLLKALGCRYAQGYLYSRPLPAKEAAQFSLLRVNDCERVHSAR